MKRKSFWFFAIVVCLAGFAGYFGNFFQKKPYARIPIAFGKSRCPIAAVNIDGSSYPLEVDLGAVAFLSLDPNLLFHIEKKDHGSIPWLDLKGNRYHSRCYLLSEIQIGGIPMKEVLADEQHDSFFLATTLSKEPTNNRPLGSIGRPLLKRINLLLDFPHSQMILTDDIKRLKREEYGIDEMTCVSFHLTRAGLVFEIKTDLGPKNFMLDTGSTLTLMRSSLLDTQTLVEKEEGLLAFSTSQFQMGGTDFGSQNLYRFDLAEELTEIDGVLGMDFMRKHLLYIDYPNRHIYIGNVVE